MGGAMRLVILIDLDDTLTDRDAAFSSWAVPFLERHQRPRDELAHLHELDQRGVRPREEFFRLVLRDLDLDLDPDAELAAYREVTGSPPLQHGVRERLAAIRADGGIVVVLTNGVAEVQRRKLGATDLLASVDDVVISEEVGVAKPDPRIYELALARVGASVDGDQVWMLGDNPDTDIKGALDAGLRAAWVNPLGRIWQGQPGPEVIRPSTLECLDQVVGEVRTRPRPDLRQ